MLKMEQWERTDRQADRGKGNTSGRNENLYVSYSGKVTHQHTERIHARSVFSVSNNI